MDVEPPKDLLLPAAYCEEIYKAMRRPTRTVWAGKVPIGSEHPIAKQTMTTTDTRNIDATVDQIIRCADMGADLVRLTVQGKKEAEACFKVKDKLIQKGYDTPLVADIHFQVHPITVPNLIIPSIISNHCPDPGLESTFVPLSCDIHLIPPFRVTSNPNPPSLTSSSPPSR